MKDTKNILQRALDYDLNEVELADFYKTTEQSKSFHEHHKLHLSYTLIFQRDTKESTDKKAMSYSTLSFLYIQQ